jgi:peroxiredoxin
MSLFKRVVFFPLFILLFHTSTTVAQNNMVAPSAYDVAPLMISESVPDVSVTGLDGEKISLKSLISEKPAVFIFYRGGWCPYCSRHLAELNKVEQDLINLGYNIYAISVDRPEFLKETISENKLNYTLLSDSPADVLKAFGIAFKVDKNTVDRYKSIGLDLEKNSGYTHHILPAPAVYIIGTDGIVDFNYINPDYKQRIDGEVLKAAAKAAL